MRFFTGFIIFFFLISCKPEANEAFVFPEGFPEVKIPETNPMKSSAILLGKRLFFDPALSSNKKVSCASCHNPSLAFSDGTSLSRTGVSGKALMRHSPALINLAYADSGLFWDGGAKNLESLVFAPLTHPDEMGADLESVNKYLIQNNYYNREIKSVYKTEEVKIQYAAKAIAQYLRTLVSNNSKYDQVKRGEAYFTDSEKAGYLLFQENCGACHKEPLFTDNGFHNNGLDEAFNSAEAEGVFTGRYRISHDSSDIGKFKTPTLRNVMLTAPYMHDGRMADIKAVLDHYSNRVKKSENLDPLLISENGLLGITLSEEDKNNLSSFLYTLNDTLFISGNSR